MLTVLRNSWALLLGIGLLMIGNGLQGTALGIRGGIEGFEATTMSWVMSAYFAGFLFGSRMAPWMIRRVGHVRVFAALGSLVSAAFILYGAIPEVWAWALMRLLVGFCFSGVYVVAESWLNDSSTNETRGQALSLYMLVQLAGIVTAQGLVNVFDPAGYALFVLMSVLVSVAFAPILLSVSPAPPFSMTKRMTLIELFRTSPLGVVSAFLLGLMFAAMFGMSAVYGTERGLSVGDITIFVAMFYIGGLIVQYPLGWLSDRMDRRVLVAAATLGGAALTFIGLPFADNLTVTFGLAFVVGGLANPLYSLIIAYTADFLEPENMAAASSGLLFVNGVGAIFGPFIVGGMMGAFGANAFFLFNAIVFAVMGAYALYRMTRRPSVPIDETARYTSVLPTASPVAFEVAAEIAIEAAEELAEEMAAEATDGVPERSDS